ncbi:hypothetical protein [Variovorax sp. EBFNA2]|uniref:hypothetical protein n=1 Tax=Variovorax sp. EBFNA2 TaxID=3342097 RepID=UPI0029BFE1AE|nr:hypothetical protein [Variovorax boronicumulans]WPG35163.1 hypothetical protein RZE79_16860 [Variovorax boronicumulans]
MSTPHITQLRTQLLDTLADLRNREHPMEPDRARAIAQVASVLVDSAKVEVDYLRATNQASAPFLEAPPLAGTPTAVGHTPSTVHRDGPGNGITAITRHTLQG